MSRRRKYPTQWEVYGPPTVSTTLFRVWRDGKGGVGMALIATTPEVREIGPGNMSELREVDEMLPAEHSYEAGCHVAALMEIVADAMDVLRPYLASAAKEHIDEQSRVARSAIEARMRRQEAEQAEARSKRKRGGKA